MSTPVSVLSNLRISLTTRVQPYQHLSNLGEKASICQRLLQGPKQSEEVILLTQFSSFRRVSRHLHARCPYEVTLTDK